MLVYVYIYQYAYTYSSYKHNFRNFELCSVNTAIGELFRRDCTTSIWNSPSPMATCPTYQDGHIWRNILNADFKRPG